MSKIAIVTGAGGGIGAATADALTDRGYYVIGVDIKKPLKTSCVAFHIVNLVQPEEIERFADDFRRQHGSVLHALVNNAGISGKSGPIEETTQADWDKMLDINARSVWLMVKNFLPYLKEAEGASIVNVASVAAHQGGVNSITYTASKGAVLSMSRSMAMEFAPYGIRVNTVSPGAIETPMTHRKSVDEEIMEDIGEGLIMGRWGRASECATTIAFLISNDASYTTGQDLIVDGGMTTKLTL